MPANKSGRHGDKSAWHEGPKNSPPNPPHTPPSLLWIKLYPSQFSLKLSFQSKLSFPNPGLDPTVETMHPSLPISYADGGSSDFENDEQATVLSAPRKDLNWTPKHHSQDNGGISSQRTQIQGGPPQTGVFEAHGSATPPQGGRRARPQ